MRRSRHVHNYVRGEQEWTCLIGDKPFKLEGYLFAQQNGMTNVCSHAALRTIAARFESGRNLSYRQINEIVGIDFSKKKARPGLRSDEIAAVLKKLGIGRVVGDFRNEQALPPAPFQRILYAGIESGYPAIVFFRTHGDHHHVIPVFGHTFNEDTWVPSAEHMYFDVGDRSILYSDAWLSMFIAHDDNVGSNVCVPRHYLQTKKWPSSTTNKPELNSVAYIISTAPRDAKLYFAVAERAAYVALTQILDQIIKGKTITKWVERMVMATPEMNFVARPILVRRKEYLAHINKVRDWHKNPVFQDSLAKFSDRLGDGLFWMIEFSIPDLFSATKRKLAEVLIRADKVVDNPSDLQTRISARLPGWFALSTGVVIADKERFEFVQSGLENHIELYGCEDI